MNENLLNSTSEAAVDIISLGGNGGGTAHGGVAARLLASGMNVAGLRTLDILRKDEWVQFDEAIVEVARARFAAVADLMGQGLRFDVANALGTTRIEWERVSDMDPAELSMSGVTPGQEDGVLFDLAAVPLPIIHKDFAINIRTLEASRSRGEPLDTTQAELATRLVVERIETLLFQGSNIAGTNFTIPGYQTAANRNTGSLGTSWLTETGLNIVADVIAMIAAAHADNMYGPYMLYVPNNYAPPLSDDYKTDSDKTILQRILELPGILGVRPTAGITADNVLLVQMSRDVVDMVVGLQPVPVTWDEMGGMRMRFKIMAIMVPRVKSDYSGQSGIVHFS